MRARGFLDAIRRTKKLGLHGQVLGAELDDDFMAGVPEDLRGRLLTKEEVRDQLEGKGVNE